MWTFWSATVEHETAGKFISFMCENGVRLGIKVGDKEHEFGGHGTIFVEVEGVETWYQKALDTKRIIYKPLTIQPWAKSFSILDSDGNKVEFLDGK